MNELTLREAIDGGQLTALTKKLDEFNLSVRCANGLAVAGAQYLWEVAGMTEAELLKTKNIGRKSFHEVQEILEEHKLSLGMLFATDLNDAIREKCERGPASFKDTVDAAQRTEPIDYCALRPSELVLLVPTILKERRARLDNEYDMFSGLLGAISVGLTVIVNDTTPEPIRRFMEETGGQPTSEQIYERRKTLSTESKTVVSALSGGWNSLPILRQVSVALKLLEEP